MTGEVPSEQAAAERVGEAVWRRVHRLAELLRRSGADPSLSELLDAATALRHVGIDDRELLRIALCAVLIKHPQHRPAFDVAFDRCFPPRPTASATEPGGAAPDSPGAADRGHGDDLGDRIRAAVATETDDLRVLAEQAVRDHGGFDGEIRTERYHLYRVLRAIDLARLVHEAMRRAREEGDNPTRREVAERVEALRRLITEQVRARLLEIEPSEAARRPAGAFDVELARANADELARVRSAVRPLARQLAARLRRRRRTRSAGRADMRRTIRRSIASGGVPFEVLYRRPHPHRPEVFSLCDLSGSVADFAGFTLTLLSALADEVANTRSFAFVDAIDEITQIVEDSAGVVEPWQILQGGHVIGADGHSDYGAVFDSFWSRWARAELTDRSTVIITGDARTNHRPDGAEVFARIAERARAVYWLNPEPRADWNTSDSALSAYAPHCDEVLEVRTLRQISAAVEHIL
jgi:uncharacterized protein with von Willebrand factor type A (vWA) domain